MVEYTGLPQDRPYDTIQNKPVPDYMESAFEFRKGHSAYHWRTDIIDPRWDTVVGLGRFGGDWNDELNEVIEASKPVKFRERTFINNRMGAGDTYMPMREAETSDLQSAGYDTENHVLRVNVDFDKYPTFKKMVDLIGLGEAGHRFHIQYPGEAFPGHLDGFHCNWPHIKPESMIRIGIMLKDWEQGHFFQYGNYPYQQWRAGDVHTFAYRHVPHYTANSGFSPRAMILTTGIITDQTIKFLKELKDVEEYNLNHTVQ